MIKNIFNPGNYSTKINWVLFILRTTVGIFMFSHGLGKFLKLFGDAPIKFSDPLGVGATISLSLTVFAEVFCSTLLIFGLGTRLAAIPLLITMLVVAFIVQGSAGFGKMELPLLYSVLYFTIAITGAGKFSLDNYLYKRMFSTR